LLVDTCFAWIIDMASRGIGRPLIPKRVELQRAPINREIYETHFRCAVRFKSNQNTLVFSKADMDLPFVTYNADLLSAVAPQLEAELARQLAEKTFTEQAKGFLKQLLAGQRPGIDGSGKRATDEHSNVTAPADGAGHHVSAVAGRRPP
jgi:hypothetical protein